MTTATIVWFVLIVFNFETCGDLTYKAIWTLDIGWHSELWVKDGDNHDTFAVAEYIIGHVLKAITYHHLFLKICTCGTIRGCATIKINHKNKDICTRIVTHCATIHICATNRVNTVFSEFFHMWDLVWDLDYYRRGVWPNPSNPPGYVPASLFGLYFKYLLSWSICACPCT